MFERDADAIDESGYCSALREAGASVLAFAEFGSYQGNWWALVDYEGKRGWVTGSYGSCSGCDAFEGEFGFCEHEKPEYKQRLAAFGQEYLDAMMTHDEALAGAEKDLSWDVEADEMVAWIKSTWSDPGRAAPEE